MDRCKLEPGLPAEAPRDYVASISSLERDYYWKYREFSQAIRQQNITHNNNNSSRGFHCTLQLNNISHLREIVIEIVNNWMATKFDI